MESREHHKNSTLKDVKVWTYFLCTALSSVFEACKYQIVEISLLVGLAVFRFIVP
jgi:hypothetical protein